MKKFSRTLFFLLCLLCSNYIFCQIKFITTINPNKIGKNGQAELKFIFENGGNVEQFNLPNLKKFVIISGPNQESSTTYINNVIKKYVAISYIIKPTTVGTFTIPSTSAIVDGKKVFSNATTLQVTNASTGNNNANSFYNNIDPFIERRIPINDNILKNGESAQEKVQKNMFLLAEVDKISCFINEPIVVTYKLYTRLKSESTITKNASFNGFSVIDFKEPIGYDEKELNGKKYNVYTIRKAQLYPLQPGNIEIEKIEIENNIQFIKEEYLSRQRQNWADIFNEFSETILPAEAIENYKAVVQSKPVFITAKPLPKDKKPENFKGAVGNFSIIATLEKNNFTTDESGKLSIKISGEGNLQLVTAPEMSWPKGVEGFSPKILSTINELSVPTSGEIIYEYFFTVDSAGEYTLPPISFSYFDNKNLAYKNLTTNFLKFEVSKGKEKNNNTSTANKDKKHISRTIFSSKWLIFISIILIALITSILWLKKKRKTKLIEIEKKDKTKVEPENEYLYDKNWLENAERSINSKDFYSTIEKGLINYISNKLKISSTQINKQSAIEQFKLKHFPVEITLELETLMSEIQLQLYMPFTENYFQQKALLEKVKELMNKIDNTKN